MSQYTFLLLIFLVLTAASGCRGPDNAELDASMRIAEALKKSAPDTTDAVKINGFFVQSDKEVLILATLINWNSKDKTNRDLMKALAYDSARGFTCRDKALRELLADGVALNVAYASNDDKDTIGVKVIDQSCRDITTNPPVSDMLKKQDVEKESEPTTCTPVGSARKTDTGNTAPVYRCTKPDGSIYYGSKIDGSDSDPE